MSIDSSSKMTGFETTLSGQARVSLESLTGDVDVFFKEYWRKKPLVRKAERDIQSLISEADMWAAVRTGLLVRPYFVAFNEGVRSALSDITETRTVAGHQVAGYINGEQVQKDFAAGGTFKLNQPEHWMPQFKALVDELTPCFRAELETYVFLSPPDRTAITTHMDGSHVFVLQVAGKKDWTIGLLDDESISGSDRYRGPELTDANTFQATLEAGDVLYMPHGSPHHATAREGNSIHVALTVEEPTPKDFVTALLADLTADPQFEQLEADFHRMRTPQVLRALRELLDSRIATSDSSQTALIKAVDLLRSHYR